MLYLVSCSCRGDFARAIKLHVIFIWELMKYTDREFLIKKRKNKREKEQGQVKK